MKLTFRDPWTSCNTIPIEQLDPLILIEIKGENDFITEKIISKESFVRICARVTDVFSGMEMIAGQLAGITLNSVYLSLLLNKKGQGRILGSKLRQLTN